MLLVVPCIGSTEFAGYGHRGKAQLLLLLSKASQAGQHLEHYSWNILQSCREFHKQVRGMFIPGITDQLLPHHFIRSA